MKHLNRALLIISFITCLVGGIYVKNNPIMEKFSISEETINLRMGETGRITPVFYPSSIWDIYDLTLESSDEDIVRVSKGGYIDTISPGQAIITATTKDGKKDTCKVIVSPILIEEITIDNQPRILLIGETGKFNVMYEPGDPTNRKILFTSLAPDTVSIDDQGNYRALNVGTAYIKIHSEDGNAHIYHYFEVVAEIKPTSISIPDSISLNLNSSRVLTPLFEPYNTSIKDVEWESSDTNVVTVEQDGTITALALGSATITVRTPDGLVDTCHVTVPEVHATSVEIRDSLGNRFPGGVTLSSGQSQQLRAHTTPGFTTDEVSWRSNDTSIVTVDENGMVRGISRGYTHIVVTVGDVSNFIIVSVDLLG